MGSRGKISSPMTLRLGIGSVLALVALAAAACGTPPTPAAPPQAPSTTASDVSLVVANGIVITMDDGGRVLAPGSVAIRDHEIVAVDTPAAIDERYRGRERVDATGQIVMPGLINTHTHAPMVLYRGLADDLALMEWLEKYIFPAEAKTVSPEFVRVGTRLAALEMIRSGTTLFADMYYFEEEVAEAVREAGIRGVLGQTIIQFPVPDAKTPEEGLKRTEAFITRFAGDTLVTPAVAPHSMYTLRQGTLLAARDLALKYDVPLLTHLAETQDEVRIAEERYKQRPVEFLSGIKFWAPRTLAAHGVWVNADEVALLKGHGVGVSHNPESNMKLASGTAPVPAYLKAGVKLGLGTDGAASNNDLDMFEAMRQAAFLHKLISNDPRVVSAREALTMATMGGARALGLQARLGSLEPGKYADLIIVRADRARQTPMYDPVSHLVYATHGDDVVTTVVHGRVLMRDGVVRTLNEAQVLQDARRAAEQVRKAVQ
jgi:5-methylthioadenosine/S-adenosylhomocysteine deaminase